MSPRLRKLLRTLPLALLLLLQLLPIALLLLASLRTPVSLLEHGPLSLRGLHLGNYREVITRGHFLDHMWTSTRIALSSTALSLGAGSLAAYALARLEFRGRRLLAASFLVSRLIPPVALAIPVFLLLERVGHTDTPLGLVLAHTSFNLPFAIWLMMPFFAALPREYEEAASIDGCTRFQAFRIVIFPLALPGLLVAGIFCFLLSWNDFLFSLVLAGSRTRTASLAVNGYMTSFGPDWGPMSAASVLILVPVFLFSLALQRHIVSGLGAGGVKH
jgi:multiple sugar transport system permease protein